jgi:flagellar hook assembly protein FlgD
VIHLCGTAIAVTLCLVIERQFVKIEQLMEQTMAITGTDQASQIQMDYMKLLVTQMQNQNPLEPMDNNQMTSQLTQISQLQEMETQTSTFSEVLETTERNYASSLLGKEVSYYLSTESGELTTASGVVDRVTHETNGTVTLSSGGTSFSMDDVASVREIQ